MPDSGTFEWLAPEYSHMTFDQVFPDSDTFKTKLRATNILTAAEITDAFLVRLFYLLYAKHGTDPIKSSNYDQWVYKVAYVTEAHAPEFLKREDIQKQLRALTETDLREGYKNIFNHAVNPSTTPSTDNTNELPYITDQNVNKGIKAKADAYAYLWEILRSDVMERFLSWYDKLFSMVASTTNRIIYYN